MIRIKYQKGKSVESIADELETTVDDIMVVYDLVARNPGKTDEELVEMIEGK